MPCLEFEGKNLEKATEKACKDLNLKKEDLKYDVISYGSSGIFGLVGSKKARIRVYVPENETTEDVEAIALDNDDDRLSIDNRISEKLKEEIREEVKELFRQQFEETSFDEEEDDDDLSVDEDDTEMISDDDDFDADDESDDESDETEQYLETADNSGGIDPIVIGEEVLERLVNFITTDAKISSEKRQNRVVFKIEGGNSAILIGKRGKTLNAIQYLVDKIINKQHENKIRVTVDVEGYLDSRKSSLKRLASKLAEKSKKTGKPVTIGQMNAHDRRIVHLALKDDHSVRTQSVGDGYYRKLVIFPGKSRRRKSST